MNVHLVGCAGSEGLGRLCSDFDALDLMVSHWCHGQTGCHFFEFALACHETALLIVTRIGVSAQTVGDEHCLEILIRREYHTTFLLVIAGWIA